VNYRDQIISLLDRQLAKGQKKYGQPLEQNPASIRERLQHSAEEQIDNLCYTLWAIDALQNNWSRFPRIKFADTSSISIQADHLISECEEVQKELIEFKIDKLAIELFDLIHSAETMLWIIQKFFNINLIVARQAVINKNQNRGYYDSDRKGD
jgi:hypothetical protein